MLAPQVLGYSTFPCRGEASPFQNPVVLVRGLGRSSGFWLDFIDVLTPRAKVFTIDLLGTGKSPSRLGRGSVAEHAGDLLATLERAGMLPCHLVGISLGGMVCLAAAAQLARRALPGSPASADLASLTVIAASARFTGERRIDPRALVPLVASLRHRIPRNREFARFLVAPETLAARPDLPELWDAVWQEEGFAKVAVIRQLLAAAAFHGREELDAVRKPCLFLASRDDALVDWRNTLRMWERKPGARLRVFEGAGHDVPTDRPRETADVLFGFFDDVEAGRPVAGGIGRN